MHFSLNNMQSVAELIEYSQKYKEIEEWKKADCIVYIINMYDENEKCVFTKIGKSNNVIKRFQKLERQYYATQGIQIARIEPIHIFNVKNDDLRKCLKVSLEIYSAKRATLFQMTDLNLLHHQKRNGKKWKDIIN